MKETFSACLFSALLLAPAFATAGEKTVKLSVPGMTCASCPYMVKEAVSMVDGVKAVSATMTDRSATVTFDDAVTNIEEIRKATQEIGYPSTVIRTDSGS